MLTLKLSLKLTLWQWKKKPIRFKATDVNDGCRRSFSNTNGFLALGSSRRFTKLDWGMETRFSRAPGTLDYCSRTETTQNKMMSGTFLALATIHMFVQEKKVGARRHGRLRLKKSLFVPATVVRLFREFILKVQLPQQHGQGQCQFGVCQHARPFSTRCELHGYLPVGVLASSSLASPHGLTPPFSLLLSISSDRSVSWIRPQIPGNHEMWNPGHGFGSIVSGG